MSSQIGRALRVQLFGESHGAAVGVTLDGLPPGFPLDEKALCAFLARRAARGELTTARRESDIPRILSGLMNGVTTGQPLTAVFDNNDARGADYAFLPDRPRPGHADYPAHVKSGGYDDLRGGGHHSGRLTLAHAFAGGVALQLLSAAGVRIGAHICAIGDLSDTLLDPLNPEMDVLERRRPNLVPMLNPAAARRAREMLTEARLAGDSLGGTVEVAATGVPVGLGAPYFDGVEALAAREFFSIPAVKGVEFGAGFGAAGMRGSEYNDPYAIREGRVVTTRNAAGGLLGGLTNGMPVIARVAFRPTPSIALEQQTVSLTALSSAALTVGGRHDPCVAVRAVPVVEGALALALCELWLERRGDGPFQENEKS